jgi:GNAT superfamily N-acetyltransferase
MTHPPTEKIEVALADMRNPAELDAAVPLFDAYRQFYEQPSDAGAAKAFLRERGERGQSVVLLARDGGGQAVGLVQNYPSFSSASMAPIWVLNDLFVAPEARRLGVARALLAAAAEHARRAGAVRLMLRTQVENSRAQALYESMRWQRDAAFLTYNFPLN